MRPRLRREGDRLIKVLATPARAAWLLNRTEALRRAGLHTPAARPGSDPDEVSFEFLEGMTAQAALGSLEKDTDLESVLNPCLGLLASLHRIDGIDAQVFQPLGKVAPRLERLQQRPAGLSSEQVGVALDLYARLERSLACGARFTGLIHGDFHPGQVLIGPGSAERAWLLDLEDLAQGEIEADLGNLIAHLLTSGALDQPPTVAALEQVETLVCAMYLRHQGRRPDLPLLRLHESAALLRRSLKLSLDRADLPRGSSALNLASLIA